MGCSRCIKVVSFLLLEPFVGFRVYIVFDYIVKVSNLFDVYVFICLRNNGA